MGKCLGIWGLGIFFFGFGVLSWGQEPGKAATWKIAILPGHGPKSLEARSVPFPQDVTHEFQGQTVTVRQGDTYLEYDANRGVSYWQAKILEDIGFEVQRLEFTDREGLEPCDIHDLASRQKLIRDAGAHLSVENHFNTFGDGQTFNGAKGVGTYTHPTEPGDSLELAKRVQKNLVATYRQTNRKTRTAKFALCDTKATGCKASILIEHAFMTNEQEAVDYFCNPEAWYNYAIATCKGICDYTGVSYTGPEQTEATRPPAPVVQPTPEPTPEPAPEQVAGNAENNANLPAGVRPLRGTIKAGQGALMRRRVPGSAEGKGNPVQWGHTAQVVGVTEDGKWYYLDDGFYVNANPDYGEFTPQ